MKTFKKYMRLIEKEKFTEKELIYFRKAINGSSKMNPIQKGILLTEFQVKAETQGINLEYSQQTKGYLWLKEKTFKLNGDVRKNAPLKSFEVKVLKMYSHFTCVGLFNLSTNYYNNYVPIYRCHAESGQYFDYICKMWGEIEVIETGDKTGIVWCKSWPSDESDPEPEIESKPASEKPALKLIMGGRYEF